MSSLDGRTPRDANRVPALFAVSNVDGITVVPLEANPTTGALIVDTSSTDPMEVVGNVASGATDSGNPVKIGGVYKVSQPTFADGQRGDGQIGLRGALKVQLTAPNSGTQIEAYSDTSDGSATSASPNKLAVLNRNTVFNGSTWDRMPGDTTGVKIQAASLPLPTGASTSAKQPNFGTAGTASADVLTVQGIASMTALKVDGSAVTQPVSGTVTANPSSSSSGTYAQVSVTNANTTVLAANANRLGATIYNEGTASCYLKLGGTASTTSYTVIMVTNGYYEVPFRYTGIITGITSSGTANVTVTELT